FYRTQNISLPLCPGRKHGRTGRSREKTHSSNRSAQRLRSNFISSWTISTLKSSDCSHFIRRSSQGGNRARVVPPLHEDPARFHRSALRKPRHCRCDDRSHHAHGRSV